MKTLSRIKSIKVKCDRCKQVVEGIRGEEFCAGFYDMTKWEDYRRENERYVCESCKFADPKYVEVFCEIQAQGVQLETAQTNPHPVGNGNG